MRSINAAPTQGLLRDALLFDVYRPTDKSGDAAAREKSLAVRLTLNSDEATLTETQIEEAVQAVVKQLGQDLNARLRG
jgi:phenylalanyl-tRNA synthetase beta chain